MTIRATWAFNGQTKTILGNWHRLWCLLFGPLYYLFKGMWWWAILSLITANGLWVGSEGNAQKGSEMVRSGKSGQSNNWGISHILQTLG